MMTLPRLLPIALSAALTAGCAWADVKLPAIISDHMVLERAAKVPIWGKADPGEEVAVSLNGQRATGRAAADGRWTAALNLKDSPPGPFELTVEGKNKLVIDDVVVGEVWVASGQSNMAFVVKNATDAESEIARSENPLLRQFLVKRCASGELLDDTEGKWIPASPGTVGGFSAVGYYFARMLQSELKVPVGLIHSSWGGTPSEAWTSAEGIGSVPELQAAGARLRDALSGYPEKKKAFADGLGAWIKGAGREDKPSADAAAFAGLDVSPSGWISVKLPGEVRAAGLPEAGVIWLRKEVSIPAKTAIALSLPIDGFDSVYWNGKLIKQTTCQEYPGLGHIRRFGPFDLPPADVQAGKNVLAIRLYEPVGPAKFSGEPRAGAISLAGEWLAKAEVEFPPAGAAAASLPPPPALPPEPQGVASFLFNGMIRPLLPFAIRGVIWYQGEANAYRAFQYRTAFPLLIADWRRQWNQGDFSFYFCQLASFRPKVAEPGGSAWAELREAQSLALKLPGTGQAVLVDIGESGDIHPRRKKDAGERLARIALAKDYGREIAFSGPVYDSMKIANGKATLSFRHADGGLAATPLAETYDVRSSAKEVAPLVRNSPLSQLEGFAICGEDKKWSWADARIEGDQVVVWSDKVPSPSAVRYAWADCPTCNLANGAGLPASPFRTDDFPPVTLKGKY